MPRRTAQRSRVTTWTSLLRKPQVIRIERIFLLAWLCVGTTLWMMHTQNMQVIPSVLGTETSVTPTNIHSDVNQQRAKEGVPALIWNDKLAQAAENKAKDMLAKDYWAHTAPDGTQPWSFIDATQYQYSVAGENLARNFTSSPSVVRAWMNSPTHRANMLQAVYQETGIAAVKGKMEGQETILVVQMFGAPGSVGATSGIATPVKKPGEISDAAPNISRWLAPDSFPTPAQTPPGDFPQILGLSGPPSQLDWYRLGMLAILAGALGLLMMDATHPRHRSKKKHRIFPWPSKHVMHIGLLVATLLTLALAETGALL